MRMALVTLTLCQQKKEWAWQIPVYWESFQPTVDVNVEGQGRV